MQMNPMMNMGMMNPMMNPMMMQNMIANGMMPMAGQMMPGMMGMMPNPMMTGSGGNSSSDLTGKLNGPGLAMVQQHAMNQMMMNQGMMSMGMMGNQMGMMPNQMGNGMMMGQMGMMPNQMGMTGNGGMNLNPMAGGMNGLICAVCNTVVDPQVLLSYNGMYVFPYNLKTMNSLSCFFFDLLVVRHYHNRCLTCSRCQGLYCFFFNLFLH